MHLHDAELQQNPLNELRIEVSIQPDDIDLGGRKEGSVPPPFDSRVVVGDVN
jgi:hypothetical protein